MLVAEDHTLKIIGSQLSANPLTHPSEQSLHFLSHLLMMGVSSL